MARLVRFLDSHLVFLLMLVWLCGFCLAFLWPMSWWFSVQSIYIEDTKVGGTPRMVVVREIHKEFLGEWTVSVRKKEAGGWSNHCTASDQTFYLRDSVYPSPLTLRWWTYPKCHPLEEGEYFIHTTWRKQGNWLLPDKSVSMSSNVFRVTAP